MRSDSWDYMVGMWELAVEWKLSVEHNAALQSKIHFKKLNTLKKRKRKRLREEKITQLTIGIDFTFSEIVCPCSYTQGGPTSTTQPCCATNEYIAGYTGVVMSRRHSIRVSVHY